jgi:hypothetical protein
MSGSHPRGLRVDAAADTRNRIAQAGFAGKPMGRAPFRLHRSRASEAKAGACRGIDTRMQIAWHGSAFLIHHEQRLLAGSR